MKNRVFPEEGTKVKLYLDGGWEIEGTISEELSKKLAIKDTFGDTVILFKKKINGLKILKHEQEAFVRGQPYTINPPPERQVQRASQAIQPEGDEKKQMVFAVSKGRKNEVKEEASENPYYFEAGLSIPLGVIDGRPPGVTISLDDDFQMSMDQLKSIGSSTPSKKINFVVEENE
jgi:hypothetical protein